MLIFPYKKLSNDQSPWLFLVSIASLFLTFNAVLFFHFLNFNHFCYEFEYLMMSFCSLSKIKPKAGYLAGSVIFNYVYNQNRFYSFRSIGIGKAKWDPNNYSKETQIIINEFLVSLNNKDKNASYDIIYSVIGNTNGFFTKNFGKVTSVMNNMIYAYNKENPDNKITEKEFLEKYGYNYESSELSFLNETN